MTPFCELTDVEIYLRQAVPNDQEEYATRKIGAASNVLRRLFRNEGKDADQLAETDPLTKEQLNDTVAASVAIDIKHVMSAAESDNDLSAFSEFTQAAGGYSFSGKWAGNSEDVFFTSNQLKNLGIGRPTIARFQI